MTGNLGAATPKIGDVIATNRHGTKRYLAVCASCGFGFAPTCHTDVECGCWPGALDAMDERADRMMRGLIH